MTKRCCSGVPTAAEVDSASSAQSWRRRNLPPSAFPLPSGKSLAEKSDALVRSCSALAIQGQVQDFALGGESISSLINITRKSGQNWHLRCKLRGKKCQGVRMGAGLPLSSLEAPSPIWGSEVCWVPVLPLELPWSPQPSPLESP